MLSVMKPTRLNESWSLALQSALPPSCRGMKIKAYDCVESTNDVVKEQAVAGAREGLVVVASSQTKGKGRLGRSWFSGRNGGAYLSLLLRPAMPAVDAGWLAIASGVAVMRVLSDLDLPGLHIKWPNDVYVRNRKIAGVLVEPRVCAEKLDFAVVGIGLNVGQTQDSFEEAGLGQLATSCLIEGVCVERDSCVIQLVNAFHEEYARLCKGRKKELLDTWGEYGGRKEIPGV